MRRHGPGDRPIVGDCAQHVAVTLDRLAAVALCWPLPASLSDRVLEAMLYAGPGNQRGMRRKAEPDWTHVHHELRRPGVTLMLLWEEYRQAAPDGYGYSRWCELYRGWRAGCRRRCGNPTPPANACSSIMPGRLSSCTTRALARSERRRSSSP